MDSLSNGDLDLKMAMAQTEVEQKQAEKTFVPHNLNPVIEEISQELHQGGEALQQQYAQIYDQELANYKKSNQGREPAPTAALQMKLEAYFQIKNMENYEAAEYVMALDRGFVKWEDVKKHLAAREKKVAGSSSFVDLLYTLNSAWSTFNESLRSPAVQTEGINDYVKSLIASGQLWSEDIDLSPLGITSEQVQKLKTSTAEARRKLADYLASLSSSGAATLETKPPTPFPIESSVKPETAQTIAQVKEAINATKERLKQSTGSASEKERADSTLVIMERIFDSYQTLQLNERDVQAVARRLQAILQSSVSAFELGRLTFEAQSDNEYFGGSAVNETHLQRRKQLAESIFTEIMRH